MLLELSMLLRCPEPTVYQMDCSLCERGHTCAHPVQVPGTELGNKNDSATFKLLLTLSMRFCGPESAVWHSDREPCHTCTHPVQLPGNDLGIENDSETFKLLLTLSIRFCGPERAVCHSACEPCHTCANPVQFSGIG